jgi:hypothetical protein
MVNENQGGWEKNNWAERHGRRQREDNNVGYVDFPYLVSKHKLSNKHKEQQSSLLYRIYWTTDQIRSDQISPLYRNYWTTNLSYLESSNLNLKSSKSLNFWLAKKHLEAPTCPISEEATRTESHLKILNSFVPQP